MRPDAYTKKENTSLKHTLSVFLAAAVCTAALSLTACSKTADSAPSADAASSAAVTETTPEDAAQLPSPITPQDSLDAVNAAAGSAMKQPAGLTATEESWSTIDSGDGLILGQYEFTCNGAHYTLRAAKTTGDISGVWQDSKTLGNTAETDMPDMTTAEGAHWSRWFDGEMQYSLYSADTDAAAFETVRDALK